MAETTTANYAWTKPDPGASANTWGATLNATTDKIDAQVFANQQGQIVIGGGMLWFTDIAPANFVFAQGQSLSTAAPYDKLFAIFGYKYGGSGANFTMPPLAQKFMVGAAAGAVGAVGGENTHVLTIAELPAHPHPITDVAHNHTASQPAHTHPDPTHTHSASEPAHSHAVIGQVLTSAGSGGTNVAAGVGWSFPAPNSLGTNAAQPAITVAGALTGLGAAQPAITVVASGTNLSTTQNAGGGAAHENRPAFITVNVAIRYQ